MDGSETCAKHVVSVPKILQFSRLLIDRFACIYMNAQQHKPIKTEHVRCDDVFKMSQCMSVIELQDFFVSEENNKDTSGHSLKLSKLNIRYIRKC